MKFIAPLLFSLTVLASPLAAQEAVVGKPNAEQLFTSPDPQLNRNKQVAYNILKVLLEANQWDRAGELLSEEYVQHNPNAKNGLQAVVAFFTEVLKVKPTPVPEKLGIPVAEVMAEGDLVTVIYPRKEKTADGKTYTTAWFDTWRIKNGKAVEHWDPALVGEAPNLNP